MTVKDLISNTCYLFGIHGYTVNGCGLWIVTVNQTLVDPSKIESILRTSTSELTSTSSFSLNILTTELTPTSDPTLNSTTIKPAMTNNGG